MYVKICGLTTPEQADRAVTAGADAVGIMVHPPSPRHLELDAARPVVAAARTAAAECGRTVDVVVVVAAVPVDRAAGVVRELGADVLQLHGAYTDADVARATSQLDRVWRASTLPAAVAADPTLHVGRLGEELLLLDAPRGGSGQTWDLSGLEQARPDGRWLLAGGLHPGNVAEAVALARPWGVDVSSGVESVPGVKDPVLVEEFLRAVRD